MMFPKPSRPKRVPMHNKPRRIVDEALLDEIRGSECCVRGCHNYSDPAHIKTRGAFGDDVPENMMGLCRVHHTEQHTIGWKLFRKRHPEVKTWAEIKQAWYDDPDGYEAAKADRDRDATEV